MHRKVAILLLFGLVVLSIVYGCSATALSNNGPQSTAAESSKHVIVAEERGQDIRRPFPERNLGISGDPIEDPVPH